MTAALAGLVFLVGVGGLIALGAWAWRRREKPGDGGGVDVIPYLLLALATGTAGFSVAALARASLSPGQIAGRPTGEIAGALAGLVVAAPIAYLLWRRQSRRRRHFPGTPGWPVYLAVIELVFLTAFMFAVSQVAEAIAGTRVIAAWTDLLIYAGLVVFHWWAERREPPRGDVGELPRLVGSGVALIALTSGLIGTLAWIFTLIFDSLWGLIRVPDPAVPIALILTAAPIWAWRWLPVWEEEPTLLRRFYLGFVSAFSLTMAIGAGVTMVATFIVFLLEQTGRAQEHFRLYPAALSFLIVGIALWRHHTIRLGPGRSGARRGYEYGMAATGLGALVGSATALVEAAFTPTLAGTDNAGVLITLGCVVIAAGWVWSRFWRKAQSAPRQDEVSALPRRVYLIGMAIVMGLTAAGALIAALVVVFRALLGEVVAGAESLRMPVVLTLTSGLATWHLFNQIRIDGAGLQRAGAKPYAVTVVCSHPGNLATLFAEEVTLRVLYRADGAGIVDDEMAAAIVAAVDGASSLVWVDEGGFRVAAARVS